MKPTKKVYVLEVRKPLRKEGWLIPNTVTNIISVFSSPSVAKKWIKENGKDWLGKRSKKIYFWALLRATLDNDNTFLYGFYDKNGKHLKTYATIKEIQ